MTQIAKLLEKIRRNTRNVSLEEFESVARHLGEIEQGGKHHRILLENRRCLTNRKIL